MKEFRSLGVWEFRRMFVGFGLRLKSSVVIPRAKQTRVSQVMFVGICNPDALIIRICNPKIALKMLILNAGGLQIHLNVRIAEELLED